MNIKDKTVVITGGSKGLGKVLAEVFKNEGANVIICSKNKEEIEKTANEIGVVSFVADVTKETEMQKLAEFTVQKFEGIDIWINNAGVLHEFSADEQYIDVQKAKNILDVNLFGTIFGARSALNHMKLVKKGIIINIISTAALDASKAKNLKIYFASKWAVNGYTKALMAENTDSGVSIMAVYPGGVRTDLWRTYKPDNIDQFMKSEYVVEKIMSNLKSENPEQELIIKRPII